MKKNSFSLIEVVISVGIFLLVIGSLIAISLVNSRNLVMSKHRLQAVNLAREAVEQTVQIRDTFWLNDSNWGDISGSCWGLGGTQAGDYKQIQFVTGVAGCPLYHASLRSLGASSQPDSVRTLNSVSYTRTLKIQTSNASLTSGADSNYLKITADVYWNDFGAIRHAIVVTYLTNWKQ